MDINNILIHGRFGMDEDFARFLAVFAHEQLMEEKIHEIKMARIAHGLIIKVGHRPEIGFAHGPKSARCGEGLQF